MEKDYAITKYECHVIDKLNSLNNTETFFNDVRRFTKNIHNDRLINIWECFSEIRFNEITGNKEDKQP